MSLKKKNLRGEETALGEENGDEHFVMGVDFAQLGANVVVLELGEGVELLGLVDGDDGDAAVVLEADDGAVLAGHGDMG